MAAIHLGRLPQATAQVTVNVAKTPLGERGMASREDGTPNYTASLSHIETKQKHDRRHSSIPNPPVRTDWLWAENSPRQRLDNCGEPRLRWTLLDPGLK